MSNVWVYKFDGTIQCDKESQATSLETMRPSLESLAGKHNVREMRKGAVPMITLCGAPTGAINAYELTPEGWFNLKNGIAGDGGFLKLDTEKAKVATEDINLGSFISSLTSTTPTTIAQLPGHPLRAYRTGDPLTKDWRPDRCNIETDKNGTIVSVWFG